MESRVTFVQVYDGRGNSRPKKPYQLEILSEHIEFHRYSGFNNRPGYKPDLMAVDRYMTILFDTDKSDLTAQTLSTLEDVIRERHVLNPLRLQAKWADNHIIYEYGMARLNIARRPLTYAAMNVLELAFVFNGETNEDAIDRWDGLT